MISRRQWIIGSGALPAGATLAAAAPGNLVVSSGNGVRACAKAMELLRAGSDTLDAVIAGVNIVEDDPEDNTVGYGGLPNEEGVVELDASVMHGPTRRAGSVASLRNIKNPSLVAKAVMERTDHLMLVGEGALRFARAHGFPEQNLLTEKSRLAWIAWKESLRDGGGHNNWGPGIAAPPHLRAWIHQVVTHPPTGTINCLALNQKGEISGVTTTSGLAWKIPGRVGDSPVIGAGLYVDQDVGAAGSTGRGEENIRIAGAHTIVENMRHGMTPREACLDALQRIARNFDNDRARLAKFGINFYALRKDGQYAGCTLWARNHPKFSVDDGTGARTLPSTPLFE